MAKRLSYYASPGCPGRLSGFLVIGRGEPQAMGRTMEVHAGGVTCLLVKHVAAVSIDDPRTLYNSRDR